MTFTEFEKLEGERNPGPFKICNDDSGMSLVDQTDLDFVYVRGRHLPNAQWIAACSVMVPKMMRLIRLLYAAQLQPDLYDDPKRFDEMEVLEKELGL